MNKILSRCLAGIALIAFLWGAAKLWRLNLEHARKKVEQDLRLEKAQRAVEEGRPIGDPPATDAARGIEPKIVAAGRDQRESGDRYAAQQKFAEIREEIKGVQDAGRKEELFSTLAFYQAQGGLYNDAVQTAGLMSDPERRVNFLIAAGSNLIKEKEPARQQLQSALAEIAQIQDPGRRDSLYAQLAFAQHTRGFVDDQKMTCNLIQSADFKTGTCKP